MSPKITSIALGSVLLALFLSTFAEAQIIPTQAAQIECEFQPYLDQLNLLQSSPNTTSTNIISETAENELKIRKELLKIIVDCAIKEAALLQVKIGGVSFRDENTKNIQFYLVGELDRTLSFYRLQKSRIERVDLQSSKDLAKIIRDWRKDFSVPITDEAISFLIWIANQDLFKTAEKRFSQFSQVVINLKLTEDKDILTLLQKSKSNIEQAENANREAGFSFKSRGGTPTPLLIKTSLEHLSETYKNFFDLNEMIKTKILSY